MREEVMNRSEEKLKNAILDHNREAVLNALAEGADPNGIHEPFCRRPLHIAADEGNVDIIEILLAAGADPLAEMKFGLSRLRADWVAHSAKNEEAEKVLTEAAKSALHSDDIGSGERTFKFIPRH